MRQALFCLVLILVAGVAKGDLTLVQKVEGAGGPASEVTTRIKDDHARIDVTPQISTIVDGKTGEVLTLLKDQKAVVRISADKMKAAAEMINKFTDKKAVCRAGEAQAQRAQRGDQWLRSGRIHS